MLTPDRPTKKPPPHIMAEAHLGLIGFVSWELVDAETGKVKRQAGPYPNVIVDAGMNRLGSTNESLAQQTDYLAVGTGTTAPSQSDTSLVSEVARTNNLFSSDYSVGANNDFWRQVRTWEFGKTEANDNLTELGVFNEASGQAGETMWMRQLFKDSSGNDTTITKTSDEILRVKYELRIYPDKTVKTKSIDVDTRGTLVTTTVDYLPENVDSAGAWGQGGMFDTLGVWNRHDWATAEDNTTPTDFVSVGPGGTGWDDLYEDQGQGQAYTSGNFYRDVDFVLTATESNYVTGIGAIGFNPGGSTAASATPAFISTWDPKIDKTDTDELSITFRLSWSRVAV